jgi:hypothetical protein
VGKVSEREDGMKVKKEYLKKIKNRDNLLPYLS